MSSDTFISMAILALIFGGTFALYGFLLLRRGKALLKAMRALRDKIDGTKHWP